MLIKKVQCSLTRLVYPVVKTNDPYIILAGNEILMSNKRWKRVSTGCRQVDRLLSGGVPCRGITELAGQSGSGKTQLCLQLALTVQLPLSSGGLDSGKNNFRPQSVAGFPFNHVILLAGLVLFNLLLCANPCYRPPPFRFHYSNNPHTPSGRS